MLASTAGLVVLAVAAPAVADTSALIISTNAKNGIVEIKRVGSQLSSTGSADYFTGIVRMTSFSRRPIRRVSVSEGDV